MILVSPCAAGDMAHLHRLGTARLIHASSGVVTVKVAERRWSVTRSGSLWVPADTPHELSANSPLQLLFVDVDRSIAGDLPATVVRLPVTPMLRDVIARLARVPPGDGRDRFGSRLRETLVREIRDRSVPAQASALPTDHPLHALCAAFVEDPGSRATADVWAARFGMSRKTLSRSFQLELQMTFGAWQRGVRVDIARRRLGMGETVTAIAYDLGYESLSAFTAMFRRTAGMPPSKAIGRALSP